MAADFDPAAHLPDDLLERVRARAADVDRDNVFPHADLAELQDCGYLRILVPADRGGAGLSLAQASALQQRLAAAAPATALAVNMHLVWTAVARILRDRGDDALAFVQEGAADGEILAFGISEAGGDAVLFDSDTSATATADGGYAFTGTKIFTSLAPVWTSLGVHGRDDTDPDHPRLVFAFLPRDERVVTRDDWDTLGMRGTQSRTTELNGASATADRIVRVIDPADGVDPLQFAIFAAFELLVASVYAGIGRRALQLASEAVTGRVSKKTGKRRGEDPVVRARIGDMAIAHDGILLELAALTRDIDDVVDHGARWLPLLSGMKHRAVTTAQRIVDDAATSAGGGGFRSAHELSRLVRDVRAGTFHPSSPDSARQAAAAAWLDA
ncbi:acyl-CoA dehydrogenase family protein [Microbacterium karelineae]|uniref:acyl-CoA dehydrogenase family protein n=1 Tax=Microbacterium karelineae TaxID=2654283 RepID=UPI0012EA3B73|nr:acyl-CoA dehydrogenase family protein [Microbacterium karelineae]